MVTTTKVATSMPLNYPALYVFAVPPPTTYLDYAKQHRMAMWSAGMEIGARKMKKTTI